MACKNRHFIYLGLLGAHSCPAPRSLVIFAPTDYKMCKFKGKIMNTPRNTNLFDNIVAAFAQGLTFGFGFRDSARDYKAGRKIDRNY
jgi:hypothetical protein